MAALTTVITMQVIKPIAIALGLVGKPKAKNITTVKCLTFVMFQYLLRR